MRRREQPDSLTLLDLDRLAWMISHDLEAVKGEIRDPRLRGRAREYLTRCRAAVAAMEHYYWGKAIKEPDWAGFYLFSWYTALYCRHWKDRSAEGWQRAEALRKLIARPEC